MNNQSHIPVETSDHIQQSSIGFQEPVPQHVADSSQSKLKIILYVTCRILIVFFFHSLITFIFDFPLWIYSLLNSFFIFYFFCAKTNGFYINALDNPKSLLFKIGIILILGNMTLGIIATSTVQVSSQEMQYSYKVPSNFSRHFYRIGFPGAYYDRQIHQFLELYKSYKVNEQILTEDEIIEEIETYKMSLWASESMRFDFLLNYWEFVEEQKMENKTDFPQYVCLMESDFAINITFFKNKVPELIQQNNMQFLHVQHFWKLEVQERYNFGIVCATSEPSYYTKLWARVMRIVLHKRYRRIVYYTAFCMMLPYREVLQWEEYGCATYTKKPIKGQQCQYLHFVPNKKDRMRTAIILYQQKLYGKKAF